MKLGFPGSSGKESGPAPDQATVPISGLDDIGNQLICLEPGTHAVVFSADDIIAEGRLEDVCPVVAQGRLYRRNPRDAGQYLGDTLDEFMERTYATGEITPMLVVWDSKEERLLMRAFEQWYLLRTCGDLTPDESATLAQEAGQEKPFVWNSQTWRYQQSGFYQVFVKGQSAFVSGNLLRMMLAPGTDGKQVLVFIDQWSGADEVWIGQAVRLRDIVDKVY